MRLIEKVQNNFSLFVLGRYFTKWQQLNFKGTVASLDLLRYFSVT